MGELDSREAALLAAQWGIAPEELPPHLRAYSLQRRNEACFSGPGVLPGEQEAGRVEYKLRLADPTPARFQQLVRRRGGRAGRRLVPTYLPAAAAAAAGAAAAVIQMAAPSACHCRRSPS